MSKPAPRTLETIRSHYLTPHMLRVTLSGAELAGFPEDQESTYIKLIFPQPEAARPLMRTYTISAQRGEQERQLPKSPKAQKPKSPKAQKPSLYIELLEN
jgi:NADPH-dependent ferric siderophore reductase